jgi:prevent-host-death family protein
MTVMNATTARQNFYKVIDDALLSSEPVCITSKNGNVVMMSEADWKAIQETLFLVSNPFVREKLLKGINTPLDECVEDEDADSDC